MKKQKIENISCIAVVSLTILVFIQLAVSYIFFHGKFFDRVKWSDGWGRVYVNLFIFVFSLSNSLPYIIRIIRTKNTKSFSPITTSIVAFTGIISTLNSIWTLNNSLNVPGTSNLINYLAVIPSLISQIISCCCLLTNLGFKIYNIAKGNDTVRIRFNKPYLLICVAIVTILIFTSISLVIYYKLIKHIHYVPKASNPLWLYILTTISGCLSTISYLPFMTRLFTTRHTYSLSLVSKVSLICMSSLIILWNCLSFKYLDSLLISTFGTCINVCFNIVVIGYKVHNVEEAKNLNISEKVFCDRVINKK